MPFLLISILVLTAAGTVLLAVPRLRLAGLAGLMTANTLAIVHALMEA